MGFPRLTPTIGKIIILLLGIIIVGVGTHAYFTSLWVQKGYLKFNGENKVYNRTINAYRICDYYFWTGDPRKCPDIAMERYAIAMIIICFFLSLFGLVASYFVDLKSGKLKIIDFGYHGVSTILLFVAGVVFMISAVQVDSALDTNLSWISTLPKVSKRKPEKLLAGFLTIIQSLLYAGVAFLIVKEK